MRLRKQPMESRVTAMPTDLRRTVSAIVLAAFMFLAGMANLAGTGAAGDAIRPANHTSASEGTGRAFVWPTTGWVAANDTYVGGVHHPGAADIAAPHHTPVRAARAGRVVSTGWSDVSGWYVRIEHTAAGSYYYLTSYTHLLERPRVREGDVVSAVAGGGTVLGYGSRTGNANMSGPHTHFSIRRVDKVTGRVEQLSIPGLTIGSWVDSGDHIPGSYSGLTPIPVEPARPFDVRVTERHGLGMYASTRRRGDDYLGAIPQGTVVTVTGSERGQYRVRHDGRTGWVAHSGTRPAGSTATGVRVTTRYATVNVRRSPGGPVIGVVRGGTRLTGFGTDESGTWNRVQWRCTPATNRSDVTADRTRETGGCPDLSSTQSMKYGWISGGVSYPTSYFPTRTRVSGVTVYGDVVVDGLSRPDYDVTLGSLGIRAWVTVTGSRNGWYRIDYGGTRGWIRGWLTAGRQ
ncbi:peptidoglycan DD-metalloendopeptidase family protein [Haloechinothrix aidingensis]